MESRSTRVPQLVTSEKGTDDGKGGKNGRVLQRSFEGEMDSLVAVCELKSRCSIVQSAVVSDLPVVVLCLSSDLARLHDVGLQGDEFLDLAGTLNAKKGVVNGSVGLRVSRGTAQCAANVAISTYLEVLIDDGIVLHTTLSASGSP